MEDIDEDNFDIVESDGEDEELELSSQEDEDVLETGEHLTFDKHTGEAMEMHPVSSASAEGGGGGPEDGEGGGEVFVNFEEEEAVGDAFMAVKPWIGAVVEPNEHPDVDPSPPDEDYALDYVFGYRAEDSRNNVYYNTDGNVVSRTFIL